MSLLEVGQTAPAFELTNQHGETVRLEAFAGQPVVIYFYPRANTAGCTTEACAFRDARPQFEDHDAAVIGISDDSVSDLESFAQEYDLPFNLLSDEDGTVADKYGSYGEKQMFGNTFNGVFRNTYVLDADHTVAAVFEDVYPDGHAQAVLEALEA